MKKIYALLLIVFSLLNFSSYAQSGTSCNAAFNYTVNGYQVQFIPATDPDTASIRHTWIFGDGGISYQTDPINIYNTPGVYTITHLITRITPNGGIACSDSSTQVLTIIATACNAHAAFTFSRDSLFGNIIYFNNQSMPQQLSTVKWSYGDGTVGYGYNTVHTYSASGVYTVCLTIFRDSLCSDFLCQPVQIQVSSVPPCNASFTNSVNNNLVQFTGVTTTGQFYDYNQWDFGDGDYAYNTVIPQHLYQSAGVFTVIHRITKYSGNYIVCADSAVERITILNAPCSLHAGFIFTIDSFQTNKIHFANTSSTNGAITTALWNFGDGTYSTDINPIHTFTNSGAYTVCLIIKRDSLCADDTCKLIQVQAPNQCNLQAGFITSADSNQLNKIYFTNLSNPLAATDSIRWTFGDGTYTTDVNPVHIYQQTGTYIVCLRVKKNNTFSDSAACVREICQTIFVFPVCAIHPAFSFIRDSIQTNKVYFTNLSTGTTPNTVIQWSFGDGSTSFDINPIHTYTASGLYNVCLLVQRDSLCGGNTCLPVQVQVSNTCNLVADFSSSNDSLNQMLIQFTNLSVPLSSTDSIRWVFGDGSSSFDINPAHTYTQPGIYTVCLRVKKNNNTTGTATCVRESCKTVAVQQQQAVCNLLADFTFFRDTISGNVPWAYQFTNISTPLTSQDSSFWNFGDSSPVVINQPNPLHTYTVPGTYIVCLTVKKATVPGLVPCIRQVCKTIVAQQQSACNLVADFTFFSDTLATPVSNAYHFSNTSAPVNNQDSLFWNFGDGSQEVINQSNPLHTFTIPGSYVVCLTVKKQAFTGAAPCIGQVCKTIVVVHPPSACDFIVDYTWHKDSSNINKIYFTNNTITPSSAVTANWSFGDGTNGAGWNTQHIYAQPGTYFVCLNVQTGANCVKSFCDTVFAGNMVTPVDSCLNSTASFTYRNDNFMPNKYFFFAQGSPAVVQQSWVITSLNTGSAIATINQSNPVYVFGDTGTYSVCLSALLANGCRKDDCRVIRASSARFAPQCFLQAFPNPAPSYVSVNVQLAQAETITASVYTAQNILIRQVIRQGFTGNNLITISNLQGLAKGLYSIRIVHGGQVCRSRFLKLL